MNSGCDTSQLLTGDLDVSVPICSLEVYRDAPWVPIHGQPRRLRPHGWVYLRHAGRIVARARARQVRWLPERPRHRTTATHDPGFGAGWVLFIDPGTFDEISIDLGALAAQQRSGLRYLRSRRDGSLVHLLAAEPLPDGDWDD